SGAAEAWQTALAIDPKHFFSLINLGKMYLSKQDTSRAVPFLERALEANPDSARAHHLRGLAYQAIGDNAHAALEYRRSLADAQYVHSIPTFYLNFGTSLVQLGLYDEAVQMLEEYATLAPGEFDAHYQLGAALEILSERTLDDATTRRAVEQLQRA